MKPTTTFFLMMSWANPLLAQMRLDPSQMPAGTPAPEIQDIAPPVDVFPYPTWMIVTAAGLALLVVALAVWLLVRAIRARPGPPPLSPREHATRQLEALRQQLPKMDPHAFSIAVSDVLRRFVGGQFGLHAIRQTSPEFLTALAVNPQFSEEDRTLLTRFLEKCDMIKFARVEAGTEDSQELWGSASAFVQGERHE